MSYFDEEELDYDEEYDEEQERREFDSEYDSEDEAEKIANLLNPDEQEVKVPWGLIHPHSWFKMGWSLLICLIVVETAIITPIRIAFVEEDPSNAVGWNVLDITADVAFMIDLVLNFITVEETTSGLLITDRRLLALSYMKKWFALDLVSSVPVNIVTLQFGL